MENAITPAFPAVPYYTITVYIILYVIITIITGARERERIQYGCTAAIAGGQNVPAKARAALSALLEVGVAPGQSYSRIATASRKQTLEGQRLRTL
jgi:hypothetical protein